MSAPQQHSRTHGGWSESWSPIPPDQDRSKRRQSTWQQPGRQQRGRPRRSRLPHSRLFTWVVLTFNLVMFVWTDSAFVFWALGDVILLTLWLITRPRARDLGADRAGEWR